MAILEMWSSTGLRIRPLVVSHRETTRHAILLLGLVSGSSDIAPTGLALQLQLSRKQSLLGLFSVLQKSDGCTFAGRPRQLLSNAAAMLSLANRILRIPPRRLYDASCVPTKISERDRTYDRVVVRNLNELTPCSALR